MILTWMKISFLNLYTFKLMNIIKKKTADQGETQAQLSLHIIPNNNKKKKV